METPTIDETTDIKWEIVAPDYAANVVTITEAQAESATSEPASEPASEPTPEPTPEQPALDRFPYPAPTGYFTNEEYAAGQREVDEFLEDADEPRTTHRDWSLYLAHLTEQLRGRLDFEDQSLVRQLHRVRWAMDEGFDQAVLDVAEKEKKIAELSKENDELQELIKTHNQELEAAYSSVDKARDTLSSIEDRLEDLSLNEIKRHIGDAGDKLEKALDTEWPEDL